MFLLMLPHCGWEILSFSWVAKSLLSGEAETEPRIEAEAAESSALRPLLPCISLMNLFTELLVKLSFVFMHCMEQLLCLTQLRSSVLTQFWFSLLFVHRIKLEIRCMIQVHVMTESLVSVTYIWMLKAVWGALQCLKGFLMCFIWDKTCRSPLPSRLAARPQRGHASHHWHEIQLST